VFALLLAMSEANAMPPNLFHVPSAPQVQSIRVLCMVSYKALAILSSRPCLAAVRRTRFKCADWYTNVLLRSDRDQYRSYMRMRWTTFAYVLYMLCAHAADVSTSRRGTTQIRIDIQLSVALFRFGHYGNGSRVQFVAVLFDVSSGTVVRSTERVLKGRKRLAPSVIRWPNTERRAQQAEWAGSSYGFNNCTGATDGTNFPLAYQPALHPWSYYDRKGRYSLTGVITRDWDGYLIIVVQGCTGAAPVAFEQTLSNWHRYPQMYLSDGQYLLGDKGMKYSAWVIGPFVKPECTT